MGHVFVAGVSLSPFGKDYRPLGVMLADACRQALEDSRRFVSRPAADCVVIGCMDPIGFARQTGLDSLVGMELGLDRNTEIYHVESGSATGAAAVGLGKRLASAGLKTLVCFGEKMKGKLTNEEIPSQISTVIDEEERERGLGDMPTVAALSSLEYMDVYKMSPKKFRNICFSMSERSLSFGALNDRAYFRTPISRDDYDNPSVNRIIVPPLTKYDCSGSYNGAGAALLVPSPTDIKLSSIKSGFDRIKLTKRKTLICLEAAVLAGREAFLEAGLNPHEINLCELHDAFKPIPWIAAEDLGLAERGMGPRLVVEEKNRKGKEVFVNRSGGFLARTHPLGASGGAQMVELVWQMRLERQYADMFTAHPESLDYGLWFNMSGFGNTCVVGIIERFPSKKEKEGLLAENLPRALPSQYVGKKKPKKDRIVAVTQPSFEEDQDIHVALIQTKEGDFRIGIAKTSSTLKKGSRIKWIKPDEGPTFVKEGYIKGKFSDLFRLVHDLAKKDEEA